MSFPHVSTLPASDSDASIPAACPLDPNASEAPECSRRLRLSDCLRRREREAESGEIDTGRYRCRYVAWGRGPTLVCVPGLASDADSFVMLFARLSAHFRCIAYDLPDGESDGARLASYRHDDLTDDLFFLLDHLRVRECALLGFSFGSTVALSALHRQPHRFTHGILLGGFAHRSIARAERFCADWLRYLPGRMENLPWLSRVLAENHRSQFLQREADVWDFYYARLSRVPLRAFARRVLMLPRIDLRPILPTIPQPILMVCGEYDPLVDRNCERELKQGLPVVARAEIEQCGHQPHLTHPEVLAELLRQYLLPEQCGSTREPVDQKQQSHCRDDAQENVSSQASGASAHQA